MQEKSGVKLRIWITTILVFLMLGFLPAVKGFAAETQEQEKTTQLLQKDDIVIDYSNELITVRANGQEELYFGFAASGKQLKEFQRIGDNLIAAYEDGSISYDAFYIDLSAQSLKADTVFYAKYAEDDEAAKVTLDARSKLKAVHNGFLPDTEEGKTYTAQYAAEKDKVKLYPGFSEDTGYFTFQKDETAFTELADVEWRAGVAMNYKELTELNMNLYLASGATLYFRLNDGDEPISKEAKLKIRKPAKAPSVKLDGSKLTIALKDKQQYRLIYRDGSYTNWNSPSAGTKQMAIADLAGIRGDGVLNAFEESVIQVRMAATAKNVPSQIADIYLDIPGTPEEGSQGISVKQADAMDIKKGLVVTNASEQEYQIAVANTESWECGGDVTKLIGMLDFSAKKGAEGALSWKAIKPGKTTKLSHSSIKGFEDSYVILYRLAPVKENKATSEREFRIASVVQPYGGIAPNPSLKSQAFLLENGQTVSKTVSFDKVDGHTLYVSIDGADFVKNTSGSVSFEGSAGKTVVIKAYLVNDKTGKAGTAITCRYAFVTNGEQDAYANDWGYQHCKKKGDDWAVAYQRAYLAVISYAESFSIEGLSLTINDVMQVIKMMRMDNPEIIQLGSSYTLRGNDMILPLGDATEMNKLLDECEKNAADAIAAIEAKYGGNPTPIQYVVGIHDFIVLEKQYQSSAMDQTMAGILSDSYTPVCASYALAFQYLCELAGIQSVAIHGDAENGDGDRESHMWNMVNLGETVNYATMKTTTGESIDPSDWYEVDITWDDPLGGQIDFVRYDYFNLTTDEMTNHETGTKHIRSTGKSYDSYPVEKCTGTEYSADNLRSEGMIK